MTRASTQRADDGGTVLVERRGAVAIVTINRPAHHNCIDVPTAAAMRDAFDALEADDAVNVVILTGAGASFSSGLDLKQFARQGAALISQVIFEDTGWCGIGQRHFSKPLIAAVNGLALAGGLELALSCDFIVASEHAQFGVNEVALGPIADGGACFRLPKWIPLPYAREMLFTGRRVDAQEAWRIGLVNRVVPHERLLDEVIATAETVARNSQSSMRITKKLIAEAKDLSEDEAWVINNRYMLESFETEDFLEGAIAFTEKRRAQFTR